MGTVSLFIISQDPRRRWDRGIGARHEEEWSCFFRLRPLPSLGLILDSSISSRTRRQPRTEPVRGLAIREGVEGRSKKYHLEARTVIQWVAGGAGRFPLNGFSDCLSFHVLEPDRIRSDSLGNRDRLDRSAGSKGQRRFSTGLGVTIVD